MSKRFLVLAFSLALAVFFGIVIFSAANKGQSSASSSMAQYDDLMSDFSNTKLIMYDNNVAQGNEVIRLINDLDSSSSYKIVVKNGANQASGATVKSVTYSYGETNFDSYKSKMMDQDEEDYYINPMAPFDSSISKDGNDVIISITFTQQK